jgi:hypothetical protein
MEFIQREDTRESLRTDLSLCPFRALVVKFSGKILVYCAPVCEPVLPTDILSVSCIAWNSAENASTLMVGIALLHQVAAHLPRAQGVASSNLAAPTNIINEIRVMLALVQNRV